MSDSSIIEISPTDKKGLMRFIRFERELLGGYPFYTAELDDDMKKRLSGKSEYFKGNMQYALFMAVKDGKDVARCAALINPRYQEAKGEPGTGFIGFFAAAEDCGPEVAALFAAAEAWLKDRGVTRIIAPYNGSALLGLGVLTADWDKEPAFPAVWTPPYYPAYIAAAGYAPRYPMWFYDVDFASPAYAALKSRAKAAAAAGVTVRPLDKKKWASEMELLRSLFNETFRDEWEFAPMSPAEFNEFFGQLKPIVDTRNILFAAVDGKVVGWCLGFPDWGDLFRNFKGTFGPLKLINLLMNAGKYRKAGLLGIGVLESCKGKGVAQVLAATLYGYYEERGMKGSLYYPVNEHNARSRKFAEQVGGTGRVVMHCYDKTLV